MTLEEANKVLSGMDSLVTDTEGKAVFFRIDDEIRIDGWCTIAQLEALVVVLRAKQLKT